MSPEDFSALQQAAPGPQETLPSDLDFSFLRAFVESDEGGAKEFFHLCQYAPGEIIMQESEPGTEIFIIRSGRVAIFKGSFHEPVILGFRGSGDMVGELAVLDNRPRSATVVALDETQMLVTDRDGFGQMLNRPPFLGLNMLGMLSQRLRAIGEIHSAEAQVTRQLSSQVTELETEKRHLQELSRLRQEMTDLIVHDLRNPLSSMLGAIKVLQLLMRKHDSPDTQELFDIALGSAGRMQRLVDSMLEVSRMESGEAELNLRPVNLAELVNRITHDVLRPHSREVTYALDIPAEVPTIQADQDRLERVLANLLDNAVKHSPTGSQVVVQMKNLSDSVEISVTDSGSGVPVEERERIFERFAQVVGEKRKQRGFGLGLSFCKLTVEAHGGRIWVEPSRQGTGSRFAFILPVSS
jgi:signal transduction histidine kinase